MKIVVTNKKRGGQGHYVGRPSPLGNPFVLHREGDRDRVCDQYRDWLAARLSVGDAQIRSEMNRLYQELIRTGRLELTCWCSPRRCHAGEIAQLLAAAAHARGHAVEIEYR